MKAKVVWGGTMSKNGKHHLLQGAGTGVDAQEMLRAITIALGALIQGCSGHPSKYSPSASPDFCTFLCSKNSFLPKETIPVFRAQDPNAHPAPTRRNPILPYAWSTHSSSAKQWAAVKIHRALMMDPPQRCLPWLWMLTSHGNSPGLTSVPVPILLPVVCKDS